MLQYLQANNRKITPQDNSMQSNKSSNKSNINHSQKIGQTSYPNRLLYKTQVVRLVEREKRERGERQRRETEKRDRGERQGIASQREEGTQAYALILKASQGEEGWSTIWLRIASLYKTQSKYTKNKSRYRTGTILLRNASLCLNIEGKSGERGINYR